ncbi:MAG: transporter ATP-binding protein [Gammaproteobacteria bacterium]|nr:transporter ATP-binding protein [Gammaproteobacteria bacterium]
MTPRPPVPRLTLRGITKRYPTVLANDGVDLQVDPGEIHALMGENGAGKSTLMKIVYGVARPDAGSIEWEGREVDIHSPAQARRLGIGMVFQHFALFETLTVAENIALALDERIAPAALAPRIRTVAERYGLPIDPQRLVHSMSVGERQRVEIVRCLLQAPKLLIMDEPTSVLTPQAVQQLFGTLRRLAAEGMSILYISHKLDEIRTLCDKATVLRAGRVSGTTRPREQSNAELARMMVGSDLEEQPLRPREAGEVRLELKGYSMAARDPFGTSLRQLDLAVRAGEIVGIAGVSGNGQKELLAALSGESLGAHEGSISLCGHPVETLGAAQRRALGLGFVPEERLGRGAVPSMSLADNTLLTGSHAGMVRHGIVKRSVARASARAIIAAFRVKCGSEESAAERLSGGNLQKFIVGREIRLSPKVMLVAQPSWGVDVGAAQLIHHALIGLRDAGSAVLVISEELDELFTLCDRIAVLTAGRLSEARPRWQLTVETVGLLMAGAAQEAGAPQGAGAAQEAGAAHEYARG